MRWNRQTDAEAIGKGAGGTEVTKISSSLARARASLEAGRGIVWRRPQAVGAAAVGASAVGTAAFGSLALGALAIGAVAVGAFAIGRLTVGQVRIGRAEIGRLRIGALEIEAVLPSESHLTGRGRGDAA